MGLFDSMAQGMIGSLGSGLISGGLGAISSIFSNNAQKKENERNREFTEYMYDKQYDNNIKMWNMQNKYDLPSAQKQRLIDAGLNPDLMYSGKGVSPSPNLQAAVAGSASSGSLPGYGGVADAFNQGRLVDSQVRLTEAQTKNLEADSALKDSQRKGNLIDNRFKSDFWYETIDKLRADNKLSSREADYLGYKMQESQDTINKLRAETDVILSEAEIKKIDAAVYKELTDLKLSIEHSREAIATFEADTWYDSFKARIKNLEQSTESMRVSSVIDEFASTIMQPLAEFTKNHPNAALTLEYFEKFLPSITSLISSLLSARRGGPRRSPYEGPNHPTP